MVDEFSPTPEQDDIIKFEPSGHLLIRGEAGSGKTTVLTARARHLQNDMFSGNLLFLTFNVALARYIEKLLKNFGCEGNITVSTVHQWASNFYRDAKGQGPRLVKGDERIQMILDAKTKQCEDPRWRENHLAKEIDEFWDKEIEWIVGQGLSRLEQYKKNPLKKGSATGTIPKGPRLSGELTFVVEKLSVELTFDYLFPL